MHRLKYFGAVEKSNGDNKEPTQPTKKSLPFIRTSKPAKRRSSPSSSSSRTNAEDPFSHLVQTGNILNSSNQPPDAHSNAYRRIGSLSGKRVCRRPDPTESPHVSVLCPTNRITVLPSWENLVSKRRRGGKKNKLQHKAANTGGAWKTVDDHVVQLKRKSACFDRSVTEDITKSIQQPIKDVKTEMTNSKPEDSKWDSILSISTTQPSHLSSHLGVPQMEPSATRSNNTVSSNSLVSECPPWKPAPVVGKFLETTSNIDTHTQENWQHKLTQDATDFTLEPTAIDHNSYKTDISRLTAFSESTVARHLDRQTNARMTEPLSHESTTARRFDRQFSATMTAALPSNNAATGFQRVPSNEQDSISLSTSPWPDMWSPLAVTENDKFHEE